MVFAVGQTGISLNNSGETITLLDPSQSLIDSVNYGAATTGQAYARVNDIWAWTTSLTPGEANQAGNADVAKTTAVADDTNTTTDPGAVVVSIAQAKQAEVGSAVQVTGVVTVLPGTFGTQYFYIQDSSSGIQIFSSKKLFPELTVGDMVQVVGTVGTANGEIKLNTTEADAIKVLCQEPNLPPAVVTNYNPMQAGQLVQVSGLVQAKSGSTITLDNSWELYVKRSSGIKTSQFDTGQSVTVTGIIVANNDGIRVWPRSPADLATPTTALTGTTTSHSSNSPATTVNTSSASETTSNPQTTTMALIGLGSVVAVVIGLAGLSRSDSVKRWLQSHVLPVVQNWVTQLNQWVGLRKNTTDLNALSRYHESHPLEKKLS